MRAARYLGVPPWELAEKPSTWLSWAITAESAEVEARKTAEEQASKKA